VQHFRSFELGDRLVQLLENAGEESKAVVKISNVLGKWFNITIGTKQGDPYHHHSF